MPERHTRRRAHTYTTRRRSDGRYEVVDEHGNARGEPFDSLAEAEAQAREEQRWSSEGFDDPGGDGARDGNYEIDNSAEAQQRRLDEGRARTEAYDDVTYNLATGRWERAGDSGGGGSGGGGVSDFDAGSADIPIWGWLSGASARRDAAQAMSEQQRREAQWYGLGDYAPTANDLAVDYGQEEYIGGPDRSELGQARADGGSVAAQQLALQQLQEIANGQGLSAADRARMELGRQQVGQAMRGTREADMAALQARGMGGSGSMLASQMGAQQAGATALSQADAQMQIAAQQRALQSMMAAGGLGSQMRGQSFDEATTRGSAIDDFNRWQTEYARGREGRNVERRGRTGASRSDARQRAYENRERQVAGATGQYATDVGRRQAEGARRDQSDQAVTGLIGGLLSSL